MLRRSARKRVATAASICQVVPQGERLRGVVRQQLHRQVCRQWSRQPCQT